MTKAISIILDNIQAEKHSPESLVAEALVDEYRIHKKTYITTSDHMRFLSNRVNLHKSFRDNVKATLETKGFSFLDLHDVAKCFEISRIKRKRSKKPMANFDMYL
ncbi:hypothetical protein [Moritella viscosa]|uniref:hypothetical protein n=1 Tax=Moritella viscosa TaxID=80854 RepID=UPI00094D600A|nr:hypothetical protein [Moritella viscosa]